MASTNRATIINKTYKVLKKHFKPFSAVSDRTVLEQLLFACCLENSRQDIAEESFARLQQSYFDWNEIRVTTVKELAETLRGLNEPTVAAAQLKQTLQSVFESIYSFDLETLRKQNLGKSVKQLEKCKGCTSFAVAYVTQNALGGHAIPVSKGALDVLRIVGVITADEHAKRLTPGLERAVPKTKGGEFGSLLQQLGADYYAAPFSTKVRAILLEVSPDAKERFPKRATKTSTKVKAKKKTDVKKAVSKTKKKTAKSAVTKIAKKTAGTKRKQKTTSKQLSRRKPR